MEAKAIHKYARISPRKVRLIVDLIRGKEVEKALDVLEFSKKKAADLVKKVLESAIANAEHNEGADIDELKINKAYVDQAAKMRRWRARAKGRVNRIEKPTCHITVVVSDNEE